MNKKYIRIRRFVVLGWIKRLLRRRPTHSETWLDCRVPRQPVAGRVDKQYKVQGSVGVRLIGVAADGEVRTLGESDAVDPKKFHRLWRKFLHGKRLTWEDGSEAEL